MDVMVDVVVVAVVVVEDAHTWAEEYVPLNSLPTTVVTIIGLATVIDLAAAAATAKLTAPGKKVALYTIEPACSVVW